MQRLSLILVLACAVLGSLVPSIGSARCAPARGYVLERVGSGAVRPHGTVIMQLRPVRTGPTVTLPLTRIDVRGRTDTTHAAVRALAANLFAFELPDTVGHFTIAAVGSTSALFEVDTDAAAVVPVVVSAAPVLASPPLGERTVGSRSRMPTLALATAAPAESVGTIVRWSSGSWFVPNGADSMIGPGRCVPDIAGYAAITSGEAMTARFVNAAGSPSPEVAFTAP
jgi:hypothetical protein